MKRWLCVIIFFLSLLISLNSCVKEVTVLVDEIFLSKTSLELFVGDKDAIIASISPYNAKNKSLSWSSSNPDVASVDSWGLITAIRPGNTIITVMSNDGGAYASCTVLVRINTEPSYSIETESIPLQSFKTYRDEISIFYEKKIVKQTNPNAVVSEEQIQHIQDSVNTYRYCYNDPLRYEIIWYFPVTVRVNGRSTSIEKYISYEPDYADFDYNKETYEARKRIIDTLHIDSVIDAVSRAHLDGWSLGINTNWGYSDQLSGMIDFLSQSNKDRFKLADRSVKSDVIGSQIAIETSLFNIPSHSNNVETFLKTLYNITYDRFNDRLFFDKDGNEYRTIVTENSIDKISNFNVYSSVPSVSYNTELYRYFPKTNYIYPTIRLYKNNEFLHETVLFDYTEYFDYESDRGLTRTDIHFSSLLLKDLAQICFRYEILFNEKRFTYEIADFSTGTRLDTRQKIIIERDEKKDSKETLSYE